MTGSSSARCGVWFLLLAGLVGSGIADLSAGAASHERSLGDKALMEGKLEIAMKHYETAVRSPDPAGSPRMRSVTVSSSESTFLVERTQHRSSSIPCCRASP